MDSAPQTLKASWGLINPSKCSHLLPHCSFFFFCLNIGQGPKPNNCLRNKAIYQQWKTAMHHEYLMELVEVQNGCMGVCAQWLGECVRLLFYFAWGGMWLFSPHQECVLGFVCKIGVEGWGGGYRGTAIPMATVCQVGGAQGSAALQIPGDGKKKKGECEHKKGKRR